MRLTVCYRFMIQWFRKFEIFKLLVFQLIFTDSMITPKVYFIGLYVYIFHRWLCIYDTTCSFFIRQPRRHLPMNPILDILVCALFIRLPWRHLPVNLFLIFLISIFPHPIFGLVASCSYSRISFLLLFNKWFRIWTLEHNDIYNIYNSGFLSEHWNRTTYTTQSNILKYLLSQYIWIYLVMLYSTITMQNI